VRGAQPAPSLTKQASKSGADSSGLLGTSFKATAAKLAKAKYEREAARIDRQVRRRRRRRSIHVSWHTRL
jgi:hypothetical protein